MSELNFEPMHDYVLIERPDPETSTASGLVVNITEDPNAAYFGEVLAVGPGHQREGQKIRYEESASTVIEVPCGPKYDPILTKAGDVVLFRPRSGTEIELEGTKYLLIRERDLLGRCKSSGSQDEES